MVPFLETISRRTLEHRNPCEIQDPGLVDLIRSVRRNYPRVCALREYFYVDDRH